MDVYVKINIPEKFDAWDEFENAMNDDGLFEELGSAIRRGVSNYIMRLFAMWRTHVILWSDVEVIVMRPEDM